MFRRRMSRREAISTAAKIGISIAVAGVAAGVGGYYVGSLMAKPPEKPVEKKLAIYHWWTAGGEREAIDALYEGFKEYYPGVEIIDNPAAGGGGGVMRAAVMTMLMAGQAPDTFQLTYGKGQFLPWIKFLEPIDDIWGDYPVPDAVKDYGTLEDHLWGIPINTMRFNDLWYNKKLVEEIGIDVDSIKTHDDLYEAFDKVKAAGYIPLAVGVGKGQKFWHLVMECSTICAVKHGGPEYLEKLYTGKAEPEKDEAIREMLEVFKTIWERGYVNPDYATLTWDEAGDLLVDGKAVFNLMGDWQLGHFMSVGWKPGVDVDFISWPGTEHVFIQNYDCFVLPKEAPHKPVARKWLEYLKTNDAQLRFNLLKGAFSPRLDAPIDKYNVCTKKAIANFRDPKTKIVGCPWGLPPAKWLDVMPDPLDAFVVHRDIDKGVEEYAAAYRKIFPKK